MFFRTICGAIFEFSAFVLIAALLGSFRWVAFRRPTGQCRSG